ncbi:hypothetical protein BDV06DRAFT_235450 [Aspergillus oleicola]
MDQKFRQRSPLPFDPELESLLPDYDTLVQQGQIPVLVSDILIPGVTHEEHTFSGPDENELILSIFRKERPSTSTTLQHDANKKSKKPAIYHIHGGGLIMGNRFCNLFGLLEFVLEHDVIVTSIEYRLAPAHRYPAAVEDCYAGLVWVAEHADELGTDASKIIVNGLSAGAGLAAAIALMSRDRNGPAILSQSLWSPMLDDRNDSASAHEFIGVGIWDRNANGAGWDAYLGEARDSDDVSHYAAPIRAKDLSRLPQAYVDTGSTETLRDEDVEYARRLLSDGVQCELHVWPGAYHGFDGLAPQAQVSAMARRARMDWIRRTMGL